MSSKEVAPLWFIKQSPGVINAWLSWVPQDLFLLYSNSEVYNDTCIFLVFMTNCVSEEQWRGIGKALQTLQGAEPTGRMAQHSGLTAQVIPPGKEAWDPLSGMAGRETPRTPATPSLKGRLALWVDMPPCLEVVDTHTNLAWPASAMRPWTSLLCASCLSFHLEISKLSSVSNIPVSAAWGTATRVTLRYYKSVIPQFRGLRSYFPLCE